MRKPFALFVFLISVCLPVVFILYINKNNPNNAETRPESRPETRPVTLADKAAAARGGYDRLSTLTTIALRGKLTIEGQDLSLTMYADLTRATPKFYLYTETPQAHRILALFGGDAFEITKRGEPPNTTKLDPGTAEDLSIKADAFWMLARFPFGDEWETLNNNELRRTRDGVSLTFNESFQFVTLQLKDEMWRFEGEVAGSRGPFPRKIVSLQKKGGKKLWEVEVESWTGHARIPDRIYRGGKLGPGETQSWTDLESRAISGSPPEPNRKK